MTRYRRLLGWTAWTAMMGGGVLAAACHHASPPNVAAGAEPTPPLAKNGDPRLPVDRARAIDASLRAAWHSAGVAPAARADDATFARRAYLDITGTIPTAVDLQAFLASSQPDKRRALVERLLASPAYAEHWMNYWDDVLMGRQTRGQIVDRAAFRDWLRSRFAANTAWDALVRELLTATGRNSAGGPRAKLPEVMARLPESEARESADDEAPRTQSAPVNGAVNWTLRFDQRPQDLAGSASRTFLGVQIQCAECHDHKTESWKQEDFRRFTAAFLHARTVAIDAAKTKGIRRIEVEDAAKVASRFARKPELAAIAKAKATALDGTDVEKGTDTRKAMAAWMTSAESPWFAKAIVNRMWGHFLGRGFYDPVDDMRAANDPVMVEVLDRMATEFVVDGFDLKNLVRTITATEAYGLAASEGARTDAENKLWGRFRLVPLGPEELLNALLRATSLETTADKAGIEDIERLRADLFKKYAFAFDVDETDDVPDYAGTVAQALSLLNGAFVGQGARALPGSTLDAVLSKTRDDGQAIEELSLRVLSRPPTAEEKGAWLSYVTTSGTAKATLARPKRTPAASGGGALGRIGKRGTGTDPRREAYEDLMWAWLNSSEFAFNH